MVLDKDRQDSLIEACHAGLGIEPSMQATSGHPGRDKMFSTLRNRYYMPMLRQRIEMLLKYCERCQFTKTRKLEKIIEPMKPVPVPSRCWAKIGIDLIGPLKETTNGMKYICTCVDYFSKWLEAKPLQNKTGIEVANFLYQLMTRYGVMEITITDQGREFNNRIVDELFLRSGVKHSVTSSYHPQVNTVSDTSVVFNIYRNTLFK